jgi:hypothetical protein
MTMSIGENLDKINQIFSYIRSTDAKIKFELDTYAGVHGGIATPVRLKVVNGNNILDPFTNVSNVSVNVTGSAIISEANPISIVGGLATIHVANTIAETNILSLVDSGATGLDVTHTATVVFS